MGAKVPKVEGKGGWVAGSIRRVGQGRKWDRRKRMGTLNRVEGARGNGGKGESRRMGRTIKSEELERAGGQRRKKR